MKFFQKNKKIKIVTIGGGTGSFTILSELRKRKESGENLDISAIVAMSDSGGSTGILRDQYGVLPAGDIRQCLVALSPESEFLRKLFTHRYENGFLEGHNFGNIFLSTIKNITNSFEKSIKEAGKILNIQGRIFPSTLNKIDLFVKQQDGKVVKGEGKIDNTNILNYQTIFLKNNKGNPPILNHNIKKVLAEADIIIIAPGNFYNSIIPNFLVKDFAMLIKKASAKKIFITNLTTKKGHTDNFAVNDFIKELYKNSQTKDFIDFVIYNNQTDLPENIKKAYLKKGSKLIKTVNEQEYPKINFITGDFVSREIFKKIKGDIIERTLVRHNAKKLIEIILKL